MRDEDSEGGKDGREMGQFDNSTLGPHIVAGDNEEDGISRSTQFPRKVGILNVLSIHLSRRQSDSGNFDRWRLFQSFLVGHLRLASLT
jgi:hypothetical protein